MKSVFIQGETLKETEYPCLKGYVAQENRHMENPPFKFIVLFWKERHGVVVWHDRYKTWPIGYVPNNGWVEDNKFRPVQGKIELIA